MTWLITLFRDGLTWIRKNPLILFLVLVIIAYNEFVPDGLPKFENIDVTSAPSLLTALLAAEHFIFTRNGLIFWIATIAGGLVTMFNTGAMFAVFAKESNPIGIGVRTMLSVRTLQFLALEVIIGFASGYLALGVISFVVYIMPKSGLLGVALIVIAAVITYPLAYMTITIGAIIAGIPLPLNEKVKYVRVLLAPKNAKRLSGFYLVRMAAELLIAYGALAIARYFSLPSIFTSLVVILIITVPLTLLRTTAFVMKLEMLRTTPWFAKYFKEYYRDTFI